MSKSESQEWGRLTVILVKSLCLAYIVRLTKSLGQAVDTNELEWDSKVGKINCNTSKIIRLGSKSESQEWGRLIVRLAKSLGQAIYTNE
jgi:hypothetical protein